MLGKLLKHEFKATSRILPFSYLICVLLFIVALIARTILPQAVTAYAIPSILFLLSGIVVLLLTYVLLVMRFHKSMFGNEGYLTQTLPVSKGQLLASKMIPCAVWVLAGLLIMLAVAIGFVYLMTGNVDDVVTIIRQLFGLSPAYSAFLAVSMLAQCAVFVVEVCFAISLANTSKFLRNNVAFAIVFYLGISFVVSILDTLAMLFIPLSLQTGADGSTGLVFKNMFGNFVEELGSATSVVSTNSLNTVGIGSMILDVLLIVVFILLTNYLMKKKINVK